MWTAWHSNFERLAHRELVRVLGSSPPRRSACAHLPCVSWSIRSSQAETQLACILVSAGER
jgi:hypothetical protein